MSARGITDPCAIEQVVAGRFCVPLAEVLVGAMHGEHHHFELVTATVRTTDGREGTGYPYTGGRGGAAILAMLRLDLGFELPRLLHSVRGYLARGFNGVKIKVGRPELADDVARVRAVRELLGAEVALIVDANHALSESQAIAAARAFEPLGLLWFEEPTLPDDFDAYALIAAATAVPQSTGENLHTRQEFEEAFARSLGMPVCSHGMQELHVSLMAAQPNAHWRQVHSFPIDQYTRRPLVEQEHLAVAPTAPGIGVQFDWERLAPLEARTI